MAASPGDGGNVGLTRGSSAPSGLQLQDVLGGHAPPAPPGHERAVVQQVALERDRGDGNIQKVSGYSRASASGAVDPGGDVDVTVMAYAQWLSEMKQQATNARYQQQAELDLMRDAINANNGELVDFKRHSSQIVQQLQNQVSEIRAKLADTIAEMAQHNRQRSDAEQRTSSAIGGLQQAMGSRQDTSDSSSKTLKEKLDRLSSDVESKLRSLEGEIGNV